MKNIIHYVQAYKDKNFIEQPFNEVDALVLSEVAYCRFAGYNIDQTIGDYAKNHAEIMLFHEFTKKKDRRLLKAISQGGRFGDLIAHANLERFDEDTSEQFSAVTFELGNGEYCIAFRGTDSSVTGWKEDFNLSFRNDVEAQKAAVNYTINAMTGIQNQFYLCGHSKGGNLAIYAAMNLSLELRNRVKGIYNFDGPGFLEEVYWDPIYSEIRPRIHKYVPQTSIIGLMMERDDNYHVVKSNAIGIMQHLVHSWCVDGNQLKKEELDGIAIHVKQTLEAWLEELPFEERKRIVDIVFDVICSTGYGSFYEMKYQPRKVVKAVMDAIAVAKEEDKELVKLAARKLFQNTAEEWNLYIETEQKPRLEAKIEKIKERIKKKE